VKTAIINGRLDRYTEHQYRRISPPDPKVFAGLEFIENETGFGSLTEAVDTTLMTFKLPFFRV
jgi:hypothetical protein